MIEINVNKIINSKLKKDNLGDLWFNSKYERFKHLETPQAKGTVGAMIYQEYLRQRGCIAEIVSNEGDIEWSHDGGKSWIKDEVKTASATVKLIFKGKEKEMISEQVWVNQIRPSQKGWQGLVIVAVYPNHVKIFRKNRKDWDEQYKNLSSVTNGLKHNGQIGEEQLEQVTLIKNSKRSNFHEWDMIYTDQQGDTV
tara:strand:+ start:44 stop:631 length:588 start_codon:yes stop_codon:yes gene_type:complete